METTSIHVPKRVASPKSRIIGFAMLSQINYVSGDCHAACRRLLTHYGYTETVLIGEKWYPLQMFYDLLTELTLHLSDEDTLNLIGLKAIKSAQLPSSIRTIGDGIKLLFESHHTTLRNLPQQDCYHSLCVEDQKISFIDQTGLPHDLVYGYVCGLVQRFAAQGTDPAVLRTYLNPSSRDADGAYYEITW